MLNVELQVKLLKKLKVTQPQLLYLICVYENKMHVLEAYGKLFHITENEGYIGINAFNQLVADGYIKISKGQATITDKFTSLYLDKFVVYDDLADAYPDFATIGGAKVPLKALDEDVYREKYAKKILLSVIEHFEVVEDIHFAIENRYNFSSMKNFIDGSLWKSYRKARLQKETVVKGTSDIKYF